MKFATYVAPLPSCLFPCCPEQTLIDLSITLDPFIEPFFICCHRPHCDYTLVFIIATLLSAIEHVALEWKTTLSR